MKEYKVVVLGAGGVGKSALSVQFVHGTFVEKYDPTIEDSYRKVVNLDGQQLACEILDTAGTEQFLALHTMYMKSGHGFLLVFSLTSMDSFNELQSLREQIIRTKEAETGRKQRKVPMVLVGNKCDLFYEQQVPREMGTELSKMWGYVPYYEASARKRVNVVEVFEDVLRQIVQDQEEHGRDRKRRRAKSGGSGGGKCVIV